VLGATSGDTSNEEEGAGRWRFPKSSTDDGRVPLGDILRAGRIIGCGNGDGRMEGEWKSEDRVEISTLICDGKSLSRGVEATEPSYVAGLRGLMTA